MLIFLANPNWDKILEFWLAPSIRVQGFIILGLLLLVFLLTKLTKPLLGSLFSTSKEEDWSFKVWKHLERMLAPLYLLLGCVLSLVVAEHVDLGSEALIRPFTSAASAWAVYRLISGFIKSRAWLRLVAILAFGLAALHFFGLLHTTLDFLRMLSFKIGDRSISVLDLVSSLSILLFLLWISSIGSSGERKIQQFPIFHHPCRFFDQDPAGTSGLP